MQRERVTENIYVFTSNLYVQVTAGVIVTSEGAVVIDTLLYPEETQQIKKFITERLGTQIRYVINTHHHADHTTGTSLFGDVPVIAHSKCRDLLDTRGRESLERIQDSSRTMNPVELRLPDITFDGELVLHVGKKTLRLWHSPGHSDDGIVCLVEDEQVLFASDTVMSLPYFVDGNFDDLMASLMRLQGQGFETIIQGHGEVILRGEVESRLADDIDYLGKLQHTVRQALAATPEKQERALDAIRVDICGKSPILLNGVVQQLHQQNVQALADMWREEELLQTET